MDFTKFVSLLHKRCLFFARADKLGDPFEGSTTRPTFEALRDLLNKSGVPGALEEMARVSRSQRRFTLINCWHEQDVESTAMWSLYSGGIDGIAIKTYFDSLASSFTGSDDVYIGRVNYVDYDSVTLNWGNMFSPFLLKRKSFAHEREVRAITTRHKIVDDAIDLSGEVCSVGIYVHIDVAKLIKEVVVSPRAEMWFEELVHSICDRYSLSVPVRKSRLADPPTWV